MALPGTHATVGKTLRIDYLTAEGRGECFPALAAECVRLQSDIIAVTTTPGAQAARSATRTIPIVMLSLGDPVGTGLVDSLARPGGNVTGMSQMTSGPAAKRLELLREPFVALAYFRNLVGQQWSKSEKLGGVGYLLTVSAERQK